MSRRLLSCLLALTLLAAGGAPAEGRGAGAVEQHLLERGVAALQRAEKAFFARDYDRAARHAREAETLFRDVLRQSPGQRQAAMLAGQAAVFGRQLPRAKEWVARYRALTPMGEGDPDLHYLRAFVDLLGEKHPARAVRSLQRMYSLNARARPRARDILWSLALSDLGRAYLEADKVEEAARQFATGARIARRLGDRRKEILMLGDLGTTYMRGDRFIEAAEIYEGLATLQPRYPLWTWRLGMALANQNRFADAAVKYRKVIALQESGAKVEKAHEAELAELPLRLGNCLRHLSSTELDAAKRAKMLDDAEERITSFVKTHPRDARGHKWLGVLDQENRERPYAALAHYKESFAIDPMCEDVLRRMVQIHARYPAPEGTDADAWKKTHAAMEKDLKEGAKRRKAERDRREALNGTTGCS